MVSIGKLFSEDGSGCAMIINVTDLSNATWTDVGMEKQARSTGVSCRSIGEARKKGQKEVNEEQMFRKCIRGTFFRKTVHSVKICDDCHGIVGRNDENQNLNDNKGTKCKQCGLEFEEGRKCRDLINNHWELLKTKGKQNDLFMILLFHSHNEQTLKKKQKEMKRNNKKKEDQR